MCSFPTMFYLWTPIEGSVCVTIQTNICFSYHGAWCSPSVFPLTQFFGSSNHKSIKKTLCLHAGHSVHSQVVQSDLLN